MEEKKEVQQLTPEQQERKDKVRFRLFALLIVFDALLLIYLIIEMVMIFTIKNPNQVRIYFL